MSQLGAVSYRKLLSNRRYLVYWSGDSVSALGDAFFNLSVLWIVFSATHSLLATALIQVVWHLDRIFLAPVMGTAADRRNRTLLLLLSKCLSGLTVGMLAWFLTLPRHHLTLALALAAVVALNALRTVGSPAAQSVMPELVGRDTLLEASGLAASVNQAVALAGSALAGLVIADWGTPIAFALDAVSFGIAAVAIVAAKLPPRTLPARPRDPGIRRVWRDLRDGWDAIRDRPILRGLVWIAPLSNVAAFAGPLYIGLVRLDWHAGAAAYGVFEAMSTAGAILVGPLTSLVEARVGAGRLVAGGHVLAGVAVVGMSLAPTIGIADGLAVIWGGAITIGSVAMGPLYQLLVPEDLRGRVWGIQSALATLTIPPAALLGGWLATRWGPAPLIAVSGFWTLGTGVVAWALPAVRHASIHVAVRQSTRV